MVTATGSSHSPTCSARPFGGTDRQTDLVRRCVQRLVMCFSPNLFTSVFFRAVVERGRFDRGRYGLTRAQKGHSYRHRESQVHELGQSRQGNRALLKALRVGPGKRDVLIVPVFTIEDQPIIVENERQQNGDEATKWR